MGGVGGLIHIKVAKRKNKQKLLYEPLCNETSMRLMHREALGYMFHEEDSDSVTCLACKMIWEYKK